MIICHHSYKFLEFFDGSGRREFLDCRYFVLEGGKALFGDEVSEEFHRLLGEEAFVWLQYKAVFLKPLEYDSEVVLVLFL